MSGIPFNLYFISYSACIRTVKKRARTLSSVSDVWYVHNLPYNPNDYDFSKHIKLVSDTMAHQLTLGTTTAIPEPVEQVGGRARHEKEQHAGVWLGATFLSPLYTTTMAEMTTGMIRAARAFGISPN